MFPEVITQPGSRAMGWELLSVLTWPVPTISFSFSIAQRPYVGINNNILTLSITLEDETITCLNRDFFILIVKQISKTTWEGYFSSC